MEPNENTKSGPKQILGQNVGHVEQESPRTCKICGSPNHHGCGCEAKQLREAKEAGLTENEAIEKGIAKGLGLRRSPVTIINDKTAEQPAETADSNIPTDEEIAKVSAHLGQQNIDLIHKEIDRVFNRAEDVFGHIEAISDNFSDLFGAIQTSITIQSCIEQHLKEIHAMLKARIRKDASENKD